MSGGYGVDPQLLQQLSKDLNAALDELKEVTDATDATTGQGFEDLALPPNALGAAHPAEVLKDFASRWSWEVQNLLDEGNEIAGALDLNAGYYHEAEEYAKGVVKDVAASAVAAPTTTSEQAQKMSTRDLEAAAGENFNLRYSGDDFKQGFSQAGKSLSDEWDDVTTSGQIGFQVGAVKEAASPTVDAFDQATAEDDAGAHHRGPGQDGASR